MPTKTPGAYWLNGEPSKHPVRDRVLFVAEVVAVSLIGVLIACAVTA